MSDKSSLLEKALDMFMDDMDDVEGKTATAHTLEECQDPLTCTQHDMEEGGNLAPEEKGSPAAVEVTVHKMGMPSLEGKSEGEEGDHLTPEEAEELKKLLK